MERNGVTGMVHPKRESQQKEDIFPVQLTRMRIGDQSRDSGLLKERPDQSYFSNT